MPEGLTCGGIDAGVFSRGFDHPENIRFIACGTRRSLATAQILVTRCGIPVDRVKYGSRRSQEVRRDENGEFAVLVVRNPLHPPPTCIRNLWIHYSTRCTCENHLRSPQKFAAAFARLYRTFSAPTRPSPPSLDTHTAAMRTVAFGCVAVACAGGADAFVGENEMACFALFLRTPSAREKYVLVTTAAEGGLISDLSPEAAQVRWCRSQSSPV